MSNVDKYGYRDNVHQYHFKDDEGNPDGGLAYGHGFAINWQRGPTTNGRNGAFLQEVLQVLIDLLTYFQTLDKFQCEENRLALQHLNAAQEQLTSRRLRRSSQGTLGTHKSD